jgi:uncharacterized protein (DUF433 family)
MAKIIFDQNILKGKPIIKGTRISVEFILELLSSGMSHEEIIKEYPHLKKEDILSALNYAVKTIKHEEVITNYKKNIAV